MKENWIPDSEFRRFIYVLSAVTQQIILNGDFC